MIALPAEQLRQSGFQEFAPGKGWRGEERSDKPRKPSRLGEYFARVVDAGVLLILKRTPHGDYSPHSAKVFNRTYGPDDLTDILGNVTTAEDLLTTMMGSRSGRDDRWFGMDEKTRRGLYEIATAGEGEDTRSGISISASFDILHDYITRVYAAGGAREAALHELDLAMQAYDMQKPELFTKPDTSKKAFAN